MFLSLNFGKVKVKKENNKLHIRQKQFIFNMFTKVHKQATLSSKLCHSDKIDDYPDLIVLIATNSKRPI